jgi:hypothetical protein
MLHNIQSSKRAEIMSVGSSGRIVIEVDTDLKRMLYVTLEKDNLTLKEWFIRKATAYLNDAEQLSLFEPELQKKRRVAA